MGMPIVVDVRDEVVDDAVLDEMFDWLRWVDATFSTYKDDSEISRLNRGELSLDDAHADVREVLERCEQLRVETDGYFDVRAASPELVDPSGLVKGWAVDRAAAIARRGRPAELRGERGGDMRLRGRAVPELHWRVGIQHPRERGQGRARDRHDGARGRHLRRVRARSARRRSAHAPAADGDSLRDDHRPRARDRRRVCDGGVRDGRRSRDALDGSSARLRGA